MRIFPIIAAIIVSAATYILMFERPALIAFMSGSDTGNDSGAGAEDVAEDPVAEVKKDAVKVVVQRSVAKEIDSAVVLRGQTNAKRQVDVKAETSGKIVSEPLRKGAYVEAGQAMCTLDQGTRGTELAQARAQLDEAKSRVPEAQARVAQARAELNEAKINQNASAKLNVEGYASTSRVANSDAAVATSEASVQSALAGLQAAQSGIESAQAAVASADKEIERLVINAPFAGLLESDTAELGALLQPGALCATIIQLDPIKLVAFVPETEVNRVIVGAMAGARLAAGGQDVRGAVTFLSRSADPTTRTFRVEIEVPNTDLNIRDGQTAEILISSAGAKAHLLPQSALTLNDDGVLGVRIIDDNAIVAFSPVSLMRDTAEGVWLTGLEDKVNVIVIGQEYVTAGVQVAPTFQELVQ